MSDTEPNPLPQEIIGLPTERISQVEDLLKTERDEYKEVLAPVLLKPEEIDPKIREFENQLQTLNKKRARFYGLPYNPPLVFYIDREKLALYADEVNNELRKRASLIMQDLRLKTGLYFPRGNFIMIFINNFDDPDINSWEVCNQLRHELSHAGSVQKHRVYPGKDRLPYIPYRSGAYLLSLKKYLERYGEAVEEGHHALEDEIFNGLHPELLKQDDFLQALPTAEQLFPNARQKYEQLQGKLIREGKLKLGHMLLCYREKGIWLSGKPDNVYKDLMNWIYQWNPELFRLARDFIYGDRMIAFAREVNQTFGKGFFERLMAANQETAKELLNEIRVKPQPQISSLE